jgi:DNA-directed RNA polymerase alpha subunit/DNA-directed RNA polymerase subunit L
MLSHDTLHFFIHDMPLSLANAIRRTILADIVTVAAGFDGGDSSSDIRVLVNSGALHNEYLAHRISLLPICLSEDEVAEFRPESLRFELHVRNTGRSALLVTTADIMVYAQDGKELGRDVRTTLFPANPVTGDHILLTKLRPNLARPEMGEELSLQFRVRRGTAQVHARWSAVSKCTFGFVINKDRANQAAQDSLRAYVDSIEREHKQPPTDAEKKLHVDAFMTLDAQRCYDERRVSPLGSGEPMDIWFEIQTECALRPAFLVYEALHILHLRSSELSKYVANEEERQRTKAVRRLDSQTAFFEIRLDAFDRTITHLLTDYAQDTYMGPDNVLMFAGYHQPHPLENHTVLVLRFNVSKTHAEVMEFVDLLCHNLQNVLRMVALMWLDAVPPDMVAGIKCVSSFLQQQGRW